MKPILFNTEMVRAILDGRKTVTRRVIKPQPTYSPRDGFTWNGYAYGTDFPPMFRGAGYNLCCAAPYKVNDILYVRETWHKYTKRVGEGEACYLAEFYGYKASIANSEDANEPWKPSINMPKEAARIFLRVTGVRVERLEDITQEDAIKEGVMVEEFDKEGGFYERDEFLYLWDSTIKKDQLQYYGWDANPYVWVIEFEVIDKAALQKLQGTVGVMMVDKLVKEGQA